MIFRPYIIEIFFIIFEEYCFPGPLGLNRSTLYRFLHNRSEV